MPKRDQLTYDVEVRRRRDVPWPSILVLCAVLGLAVVLVGWMVTSRTGQAAPAPATAPPVVPASASVAGSTPAGPTISTGPTGSDVNEGLSAPEGSQQAASRFVVAWLDRNPATRKTSLGQVASPALAEQLMLTNAANIPVARAKGAPTLEDASTYSAQFTQALTTGVSIRVYLVADPQARYRWLATSVDQA